MTSVVRVRADQRARSEVRQPAQAAVIQAGQQALDDVAETDDKRMQSGRQRHPAPLLPKVGGALERTARPPFVIAG